MPKRLLSARQTRQGEGDEEDEGAKVLCSLRWEAVEAVEAVEKAEEVESITGDLIVTPLPFFRVFCSIDRFGFVEASAFRPFVFAASDFDRVY